MQEAPQKKPVPRGVYILPNLLTTASLLAGFVGITFALRGDFKSTALAIFISLVFDGLDGKIARLTHTSSEFGVQYDSLADLVAFGVTPAIMLYLWELSAFGRMGLMASFLIVACGALRLARFNVQTKSASKKYFVGLPIPAQGCTMAAFVLFAEYVPKGLSETVLPVFALVLAYTLSFLMVSRIRFPSFKDYGFLKAHPFSSMVTALLLLVLVASQPKLLGFPLFLGYILWGMVDTFFILPRKHPGLLRESRQELS